MKYWLIAVSSAVSTSFNTSITAGSPRIADLPLRPPQGYRRWEEKALARRDYRPLRAFGRAAGGFPRDQLAHHRHASAAGAPGLTPPRDLAPRVRAAPDHFAD